jgi:hypothetical protein
MLDQITEHRTSVYDADAVPEPLRPFSVIQLKAGPTTIDMKPRAALDARLDRPVRVPGRSMVARRMEGTGAFWVTRAGNRIRVVAKTPADSKEQS